MFSVACCIARRYVDAEFDIEIGGEDEGGSAVEDIAEAVIAFVLLCCCSALLRFVINADEIDALLAGCTGVREGGSIIRLASIPLSAPSSILTDASRPGPADPAREEAVVLTFSRDGTGM